MTPPSPNDLTPEQLADGRPLDARRQRIKQAWIKEIHRRAAEVDSGQVKPIPWAEVDRKAQDILDGQ